MKMNRIFTLRNVLHSLPGVLLLALGFTFPMVWWPTTHHFLALALYAPLIVILVTAGCFLANLDFLQQTEDPIPYGTAMSMAVCIALFLAFLGYVLLYRLFCL